MLYSSKNTIVTAAFLQRFLGRKNIPDNLFAAGIVVRLTVDDLKLSTRFGDLPQAVEIAEDQIAALVSGGAPHKTNREDIRIRVIPVVPDGFKQIVLRNQMRRPQLLCQHPQRASQQIIVFAPGRDAQRSNNSANAGGTHVPACTPFLDRLDRDLREHFP